MKVLFNADDFGLTKGVTDGIIKAYTDGVVRSTTLMMSGLAVDYAVEQAKKHPNLKVGIHLVLTWGKPMNPNTTSLMDENGYFTYTNTFQNAHTMDLVEVKKEWQAQIEAFLQTGLPLHHIDSHHHVHGLEPFKQVVIDLAEEYNVPVRYVDVLKEEKEKLLTDTIWLDFYASRVTDKIFNQIKEIQTESIEIMTHPAYIDDDLREESSYVEMREKELEILCNLEVPDWVHLI